MPGTFRIGTIAGIDIDIHVSWMALPTGYATCMIFRHRHYRLSSLIETAKIRVTRS